MSSTSYITISWFLLHDNAPVHRSLLVMDFSAKSNITTLEHPSPPHILLTWLHSIFGSSLHRNKHRRDGAFDATEFIKNATKQPKGLSQNGFQDVSNTFTVVGRSVHMGTVLKKMKLK